MSFRGLIVVIPTRNRPQLAERAIQSILSQAAQDISVLVSDNSTGDEQRLRLARYCDGLRDQRIRYVSPAIPLPMAEHWDWAMSQAVIGASASHVAFLQDRSVFKTGEVQPLLAVLSALPADIVSVKRDYLDDGRRPVRLLQSEWTGRIFRIRSSDLLALSAEGSHPPQLPSVLNAAMPIDIALRVRERFGNFFDSISPDFCFAYRSLAVVDSVIHFDRSIAVHYASDRSNGLTYARGEASPDAVDFVSNLKGSLNFAAPIPQLHGITNAVIHEYCLVREAANDPKFPPVVMRSYLGEVDFGLRHLSDRQVRTANRNLLRKNGWGVGQRTLFVANKSLQMLLKDPRWVFERVTMRQLAGSWAMPFWRWLNHRRTAWTAGGSRLFESPEEGLDFAIHHSRARSSDLGGLRRRRLSSITAHEVFLGVNESVAGQPRGLEPQTPRAPSADPRPSK